MEQKSILLDGAQGTRLWTLAKEAGGAREPVWKYNVDLPEVVKRMHQEYLEAGAGIISANTFSANRLSLKKDFPAYTVEQVVREAVAIAKDAAAPYGAKTALDIGPLPVLLEPFGTLEEDEAAEIFDEVLNSGVAAGAELIFFETFIDQEMMRVAAQTAKKYNLPVVCSMSFEKHGRTMLGNSVEDIIETLYPLGIDGVGMNCSLGPALALPMIREFSQKTGLPLFFKPNAGMPAQTPEGDTVYDCTPERFAAELAPAAALVRWLGGCCGTDPAYIRALKTMLYSRRS